MQHVIHWCMVIEDFAPELVYIPGAKNVVTNAISHLEMSGTIKLNTFDLIQHMTCLHLQIIWQILR